MRPYTTDELPTTKALDEQDCFGYVRRVMRICRPLGEATRLHALAADGNSPDLNQWPSLTAEESVKMATARIRTVRQARTWWRTMYEDEVEA